MMTLGSVGEPSEVAWFVLLIARGSLRLRVKAGGNLWRVAAGDADCMAVRHHSEPEVVCALRPVMALLPWSETFNRVHL